MSSFFFFFNDTATTEIYTLSLHDALPISSSRAAGWGPGLASYGPCWPQRPEQQPQSSQYSVSRCFLRDRKSTRLNSSHGYISYAVFCLKKKKNDFIADRQCT